VKPSHIEDYLITVRAGQWFSWSDSKDKVYANLIVNDGGTKPTEKECTDGLAALQKAYDDEQTKQTTDETSGKTKLKDLGLTDDEIKALTGK
jgi:hypothetical protein|tara:strand:+ start:739 stop:1014 length:276 start_codon:yes stop_codon:yes gene_type:complete